jgi:hypothetical protein
MELLTLCITLLYDLQLSVQPQSTHEHHSERQGEELGDDTTTERIAIKDVKLSSSIDDTDANEPEHGVNINATTPTNTTTTVSIAAVHVQVYLE